MTFEVCSLTEGEAVNMAPTKGPETQQLDLGSTTILNESGFK